jgi:hypothetical protein
LLEDMPVNVHDASGDWCFTMLGLLLAVGLAATPEVVTAPAAEVAHAEVGVVGAHFYYPGYRTGDFVTLLPSLRITRSARWWGAVVAPVHYLSFVGSETAGMGDLAAAFGVHFAPASWLNVDAGLWTGWPTGDSHQSLGSAHLMIAPQVDAAVRAGRWVARGSVALRGAVAWGEHGRHNHQPLVAPHDLLDAHGDFRAGVTLFDALELTARLEPVVVFIPHPVSPVGTRVAAGVGAAVAVGGFRAELGAALPLTVNRAWEWQLNGSVGFVF